MNNEATALARKLVGRPDVFRWMAGMRACRGTSDFGDRVLYVNGGGVALAKKGFMYAYSDAFPDLDDPATAGCLLTLLAEAAPGRVEIRSGEDITLGPCVAVGTAHRYTEYFTFAGPGDRPLGHAIARALIAIADDNATETGEESP